MESEEYRKFISKDIRMRVVELRQNGVTTSKGEKMSMAAIGRTLDPSVTRISIYNVVDGRSESRRVKEAIERELDRAYWIRKQRK